MHIDSCAVRHTPTPTNVTRWYTDDSGPELGTEIDWLETRLPLASEYLSPSLKSGKGRMILTYVEYFTCFGMLTQ
jgi:hypothetical protein